jgi:Lon protease-like protein
MSDAPTSAHHAQPAGDNLPDLEAVALFPLPNVVLFPRLILPLHVFEERYKQMTADAIGPGGDRQIAMALLKPGWEKSYYGRAPIEPVVCVGTILSHERLPDGKYNFLLQGHTRARVLREHPAEDGRLYRTAQLEPLCKSNVMEIDLSDVRERVVALFSDEGGPLSCLSMTKQVRQVLASPLPTEGVVDWLAFNLFEDVGLKQRLLAECDARKRAEVALRALNALAPVVTTHPNLN